MPAGLFRLICLCKSISRVLNVRNINISLIKIKGTLIFHKAKNSLKVRRLKIVFTFPQTSFTNAVRFIVSV